MTPVVQGIIIGFTLAVPIGPIGILCIRRSLIGGPRSGLIVGLSGATADVVYALTATLGLSLIIEFVDSHQLWMRLIGGLFLLVAGFQLARSQPAGHTPTMWERTEARASLSIFFLALTNPLTLFAFIAAFTAIGVHRIASQMSLVVLLVAGVFIGSLSWFTLLTGLARVFRQRLGAGGIRLINRIAGALLMLFGAVGVYLALRPL